MTFLITIEKRTGVNRNIIAGAIVTCSVTILSTLSFFIYSNFKLPAHEKEYKEVKSTVDVCANGIKSLIQKDSTKSIDNILMKYKLNDVANGQDGLSKDMKEIKGLLVEVLKAKSIGIVGK